MASEMMIVYQDGRLVGPLSCRDLKHMKHEFDAIAQYVIVPEKGWIPYNEFTLESKHHHPTRLKEHKKLTWLALVIVGLLVMISMGIIWGVSRWQIL